MKHMRSHEYHAIYHIKLLSGDHEAAGIMNVAKDHVQSKGTYPQKLNSLQICLMEDCGVGTKKQPTGVSSNYWVH